jgi:hypothetical protein
LAAQLILQQYLDQAWADRPKIDQLYIFEFYWFIRIFLVVFM